MSNIAKIPHALGYVFWLIGQLISATWTVIADVITGSKKVDPCIVHYPLRVQSDFAITAFAASITITPGTLSLCLIGADRPRELAVHAVHGSDPQAVLADLAHMEEKLAPEVAGIDNRLAEAHVIYPAVGARLSTEMEQEGSKK